MERKDGIFNCSVVYVSFCCFLPEPVLEIRSSPEGPSYPAASWVRLACKFQQYPGNDIVYQWRMSCNRTGQVDSSTISPMMDEEGWAILWVHSTPLVCLDVFRCSVFRSSDAREGQAMASSVFKMDRVTGENYIYQIRKTSLFFFCQLYFFLFFFSYSSFM